MYGLKRENVIFQMLSAGKKKTLESQKNFEMPVEMLALGKSRSKPSCRLLEKYTQCAAVKKSRLDICTAPQTKFPTPSASTKSSAKKGYARSCAGSPRKIFYSVSSFAAPANETVHAKRRKMAKSIFLLTNVQMVAIFF